MYWTALRVSLVRLLDLQNTYVWNNYSTQGRKSCRLTQSVSWGQHPYVESSMGGGVGVMGSNSPTEITLTFIVFIFSSSNTGIKI